MKGKSKIVYFYTLCNIVVNPNISFLKQIRPAFVNIPFFLLTRARTDAASARSKKSHGADIKENI